MPFVIGFPAIALCLLQLFLDARERRLAREGAAADAGLSEIERAEAGVPRGWPADSLRRRRNAAAADAGVHAARAFRREMIAWAYFLGLIAGVILFGFHIAVPYSCWFLRFRAETSWMAAILRHGAGQLRPVFAFEIRAAYLAASGLRHGPDLMDMHRRLNAFLLQPSA